MDTMEIVTVNLNASDRMRLDGQINDQMERLGHERYGYDKLGLGFDLPANWPMDLRCEITLAQLTALAAKLKMRIEIADLNMTPAHQGG